MNSSEQNFEFEDMLVLDDRSAQLVLRNSAPEYLLLALKKAPKQPSSKIFAYMHSVRLSK